MRRNKTNYRIQNIERFFFISSPIQIHNKTIQSGIAKFPFSIAIHT